ncbi:MAG: GNAT family N-acetyltransferase [Bacteroidales bacterium]|nr:GNAT family N-acetyltransferase [Clostridium sp.]MCM1202523.1 GNAT family N-acetyltransferase [Bacteroidales bacterium]
MDEPIEKLILPEEKNRAAGELRKLWRQCFQDAPEYEEFYFRQVYRDNTVYRIGKKGMLHLNPYLCRVRDYRMVLSYIVGVATAPDCRRKGIMRQLLSAALRDLYEKGQPFTYLMPADVRYYEPFEFISISEKQEEMVCSPKWAGGKVHFVSYDEGNFAEQLKALLQEIDEMLGKRFSVFAVHDRKYFERLYEEKHCQAGNLVFCFDEGEELQGFFAYAMDGEKMVVEQYLVKEGRDEKECREAAAAWTWQYRADMDGASPDRENILLVHQFPFMARVVEAERFLTVFAGCFAGFAAEGKRIMLTDNILSGNNGIYRFEKKGEEIRVIREKGDVKPGTVRLTAGELAALVFRQTNHGENCIFFSEIV